MNPDLVNSIISLLHEMPDGDRLRVLKFARSIQGKRAKRRQRLQRQEVAVAGGWGSSGAERWWWATKKDQ